MPCTPEINAFADGGAQTPMTSIEVAGGFGACSEPKATSGRLNWVLNKAFCQIDEAATQLDEVNTRIDEVAAVIGGATGRRQLNDHLGSFPAGAFSNSLLYTSPPLVLANPFTDRAVSFIYTSQVSANIQHAGPSQRHAVQRQLLVDGNITIPLQDGYNATLELFSQSDIVPPFLEYAGAIPAGGSVSIQHQVYMSNFTGAPVNYAVALENLTELWVMV